MTAAVKQPARERRVPVGHLLGPDPGAPTRLGLILIATDHTSERDFRIMLPPTVDAFVTRIPCHVDCTLDHLAGMAGSLTAAAEVLLPGSDLHAIAFGCTSGTMVIGEAEVARRIGLARPGVPVATPLRAALRAFDALGVRRISLVAPYVDEVNQALRAALEGNGIDVAAMTGLGLVSDRDMARLPIDAIVGLGMEADHAEAEAVFLACTAMRAVEAAGPLERRLGKPVVTSNQALCRQLLELAGAVAPIAGFGALLDRG